MASSLSPYTSSFITLRPHSSRSVHQSTTVYRHWPSPSSSIDSGISPSLQHLQASPLDEFYLPISAPLVVLVAVTLAFFAQTWINSLLGGDQGLGAFLSDGGGFNKSGFKPRRRPIADDRSVPGDITKPLGAGNPLPWLKLPELDFVDVAGQPKKSRPRQTKMQQPMKERDESEVLSKLESLREQMKMEVEQGDLENAKLIENELQKLMKKEGYNFS